MAIVAGAFNQLLSPGLVKEFKMAFYVTQEMIDDDLGYMNIFIKKKVDHDDGAFHVFDLGDEMLVPPDLVGDLFAR